MFLRKIAVLPLLLSSQFAFGIGGMGDIVSDPTSYSYYAKQIEAAQQEYKQATQHLNTAIETKNSVFEVERQLKGNYKRAIRHMSNFKNWKQQIKDDPLQFAEDTIQDREAVLGYSKKVERTIDSYYLGDDLFDDKGKQRSDWVNLERGKKEQQQKALKRAAVKAETTRGLMEIQLGELEQLASDVDATTSLKDSSDVNSSILLKMLEGQQQVIGLLADISTTLALRDYNGVGQFSESGLKALSNDSAFEIDESYYRKNGEKGQFNPLESANCNPFAGGC